jgi:hypothetical protein
VTLPDLRGRWTITVPEAGQILGVGRDSAYRAAAAGQIPTLEIGRRLVVPVHRLLELLGQPPNDSEAGPVSPTPAATVEVMKGPRDAQSPTAQPIRHEDDARSGHLAVVRGPGG